MPTRQKTEYCCLCGWPPTHREISRWKFGRTRNAQHANISRKGGFHRFSEYSQTFSLIFLYWNLQKRIQCSLFPWENITRKEREVARIFWLPKFRGERCTVRNIDPGPLTTLQTWSTHQPLCTVFKKSLLTNLSLKWTSCLRLLPRYSKTPFDPSDCPSSNKLEIWKLK